jgi:PTH2 family peptidyl-tRNA hydrolase
MGYSPKMYIVVRRDLEMPTGKLAAQVAHAALRLFKRIAVTYDWLESRNELWEDYFNDEKGNEAKIVLGCKDSFEIMELCELCDLNRIKYEMVVDSAKTVFKEPTLTCIGIGPVTKEQEILFKHLKLY